MNKETSIYYYSGSSEHPYFVEEYKNLKKKYKVIPSNKNYDYLIKNRTKNITKEKKNPSKIIEFFRSIIKKTVLFWEFQK